ncbi:hypothetical protein [Prauserella cavernicola]|uniref:hypothetical protein n=1 Tax=Prauserella cavernicola TaxID=2800127 RepID=UPI001E3CF44D|nr:hypothetical protein [Prauserella cavernicola]
MSGGSVAELSAVRSGEAPESSELSELSAVARLASLPGVSTASGVAATAVHAQATGRVLPVLPALAGLLPWGGLRRGSTVAVHGSTSLLLALLAEATSSGSWAAVVGVPRVGLSAARELGVEVSRLALVPRPGADFASATAALLDGVDLVVAGPPGRFGGTQTARRLAARARHRGAVLLSLGPWPGAEVELRCAPVSWSGLEEGHGYLREREVAVEVGGRGAAARPVRTSLLLGPDGVVVRAVDPVRPALPSGGAAPSAEEVKVG